MLTEMPASRRCDLGICGLRRDERDAPEIPQLVVNPGVEEFGHVEILAAVQVHRRSHLLRCFGPRRREEDMIDAR